MEWLVHFAALVPCIGPDHVLKTKYTILQVHTWEKIMELFLSVSQNQMQFPGFDHTHASGSSSCCNNAIK